MSVKDDFECLTLEDDIDFKEFVVCSFKILGEEIDVNNFLEVFKKLCSNLYALEPVKYSNYKSTYHGKTVKDFKKAFEINSNLFISLDGDDANRIEYLRHISLHLGLDLDDIEFTLNRKEKFDIIKDSSYSNAKAGEFAKAAFAYLFEHKLLTFRYSVADGYKMDKGDFP